jgi:hypothetical protein
MCIRICQGRRVSSIVEWEQGNMVPLVSPSLTRVGSFVLITGTLAASQLLWHGESCVNRCTVLKRDSVTDAIIFI